MGSIAGYAIGSLIIGILRAIAVRELPVVVRCLCCYGSGSGVRPEELFAQPNQENLSLTIKRNLYCWRGWSFVLVALLLPIGL